MQHFYAAIDKDRDYSTPYGLAASCHFFAKVNNWESNFDEKEIARLVDAAADIGADDPVALAWAGHVHAFFFKDIERALWLTNRALELDVNLATAWLRSGWVRGYAGDADGAIESLNNAIRLDPLDPRVFLTQTAMAFAHFVAAATTMRPTGPRRPCASSQTGTPPCGWRWPPTECGARR